MIMNSRDYPNPGEERYLQMTSGEQAIWAAFFSCYVTSAVGLAQSLTESVATASRAAGEMVMALRAHALTTFPDGSETGFLLRSMVNRRRVSLEEEKETDSVAMWLSHNGFKKTMAAFDKEANLGCESEEDPDGGKREG
jgi:hypothetical protein